MRTQKQQSSSLFSWVLCLALLLFGCADSNKAVDPPVDLPTYPFTTEMVSGSVWFEEFTNDEWVHTSSLYLFNVDSSFQRCNYENPPGTSDIQTGEWSIDASGSLLLSIPGQETITVQREDDSEFNESLMVSIDDGTETIYLTWESGGAYSFEDTLIQGTYITEDGDTWVFESDGTGSNAGEGGTFTWSVEDGILKIFLPDGRVGWMYMRDGSISCGCAPDQGNHDCYLVTNLALVEYSDSGDIDSYHAGMELIRQGDDTELKVAFNGRDLHGIAVDSVGNLYIAESDSNCVLKVSTDGVVTTVAGNGEDGFSGDGGLATSARLGAPWDVAVDSFGNLYIADGGNNRIRKVTPEGVISTIAGGGDTEKGFFDGEPATSVALFFPYFLTVDMGGNIYFYEASYYGVWSFIQKVSPDGRISTVVVGGRGDSGDDVPATSIKIYWAHLATDSAGYLYATNPVYNCVLEVAPAGTVKTVAGTGTSGYSGDGGLATEAGLSEPYGIAVDEAGNLYIADTGNGCIRMVTPEGVISTLIDGLNAPADIAIAPNGDLFIVEGAGLVLKLEAMVTN